MNSNRNNHIAPKSVRLAMIGIFILAALNLGGLWARIAVTVIVTLGLLSGLRSLVAASYERTLLDALVGLVQLVVHVAVLVLLWLPTDSRAHFREHRPAA